MTKLEKLLKEKIYAPYDNHEPTDSWNCHVKKTEGDYYNKHQLEILEQGRTDFKNPYKELSVEDKVTLYCKHYFEHHLRKNLAAFSSIPRHIDILQSPFLAFVDIGCGPYTCGVALKEHLIHKESESRPLLIEYYGLDVAPAMLKKAKEIAEYADELYFPSAIPSVNKFCASYEGLKSLQLEGYCEIIINMSYFLAAKKLNIVEFSDVVAQFLSNNNKGNPVHIFYLNPTFYGSHRNWEILKVKLKPVFKTVHTQSLGETTRFEIISNWYFGEDIPF